MGKTTSKWKLQFVAQYSKSIFFNFNLKAFCSHMGIIIKVNLHKHTKFIDMNFNKLTLELLSCTEITERLLTLLLIRYELSRENVSNPKNGWHQLRRQSRAQFKTLTNSLLIQLFSFFTLNQEKKKKTVKINLHIVPFYNSTNLLSHISFSFLMNGTGIWHLSRQRIKPTQK